MWIRTQDKKELINCNYIGIEGVNIYGSKGIIGSYATYERALEVLDEIEKYVVGRVVIGKEMYYKPEFDTTIVEKIPTAEIQTLPVVYHMPEK